MAKQIGYNKSITGGVTPLDTAFINHVQSLKITYQAYCDAICEYYTNCYIDDQGEFCVPDSMKAKGAEIQSLQESLQNLFERSKMFKGEDVDD